MRRSPATPRPSSRKTWSRTARSTSGRPSRPARRACPSTSPRDGWPPATTRGTPGPAGTCGRTSSSADVAYSDLLPSMFGINADYFLIQLASERDKDPVYQLIGEQLRADANGVAQRGAGLLGRSEERRVGKECRSRWSPYH